MQTYNLQFTEQELAILSKALGLMPYVEVAPLFANLNTQLTAKKEPEGETNEG